MTRRRLTPDEIALWRKVNEGTERLHPEAPAHRGVLPKPKPQKPVHTHRDIAPFEIGQLVPPQPAPHDLRPALADRLSAAPVAMDRRAFGRMRRGRLEPEARIDLHGMTLAHAHPALVRFVLTAQADGRRLVLVITGKGRPAQDDLGPIPRQRGILRHQVPDWLARPPLAQAVLQVAEAHVSHGGAGAYYVYLRRSR